MAISLVHSVKCKCCFCLHVSSPLGGFRFLYPLSHCLVAAFTGVISVWSGYSIFPIQKLYFSTLLCPNAIEMQVSEHLTCPMSVAHAAELSLKVDLACSFSGLDRGPRSPCTASTGTRPWHSSTSRPASVPCASLRVSVHRLLYP